MKKQVIILFTILFYFMGCSSLFNKSDQSDNTPKELPRELTAHEKEIVSSAQPFSYDLFREIVQADSSQNIFISPLSVSMALGMTLNGAAGETEQDMQQTLSLQQLQRPEINKSYASLIKLLTEADPKVKMKLANSIWIREGFVVEEDFKERCREFFEARIESLDFSDPSAPEIINQWVSDNTEQLIEEIIEGSIPGDVVMYLINAIYFKGDWQYQFDPEDTESKEFTPETGTTLQTEMMSQKSDLAAYVSDEVRLLDLPYGDSLFTMTLMMPGNAQTPLDDFIQNDLTAQNVDQWLSSMSVEPTSILLPKFEMDYKLSMNEVLKTMGMERAFTPNVADFSNINPNAPLFIDEVMHKSFITVNEEGTEAAAVTSVSIALTSAGPKVRTLNFDRPFVFLIRERTSGTILFMGMMKNPSR